MCRVVICSILGIRQHPWIKSAAPASEIVSFVDECMVEMSSYRALEDANKVDKNIIPS